MGAENLTLLDGLFFRPLCDGWTNGTEGAFYHLGHTVLFLGYMGGSGPYGCLFIFGLLCPGFLCLALWGWMSMCGPDVFGWNLLLLMAGLAQVGHLLVRLRREGIRGQQLAELHQAVYAPLGVPAGVFKELARAFESRAVELKAGETYAVEGRTPIDRLSFLLSGRTPIDRLSFLLSGRLLAEGYLCNRDRKVEA
ncbi:unnamed protein product [Menidia menidia]|uniref:(Atlantic silverside) hypothetical protein n=1 Tax=Menidia menidia TaxID=238744 RepID=A0A8S4AM94_9TELE|nr:unnamed protein product [Menidia menidia]